MKSQIVFGLIFLSLFLVGCSSDEYYLCNTCDDPNLTDINVYNCTSRTTGDAGYNYETNDYFYCNTTEWVKLNNQSGSSSCDCFNITNNITTEIINNITNNITVASNTITKYLSYEHNQTTTAYAILPNFTTTLLNNSLYEIRCRLMAFTNVTANSPRFRFNYSGTGVSIAHSCETSTSGTARYQTGTTGVSLACASTASIGNNLPTPFYYEGLIKLNGNNRDFTVEFYGETASTQYRVYQGSVCEIERLN